MERRPQAAFLSPRPHNPTHERTTAMTKTTRDLRSAAHALRTAANALEAVTTQLRALATEIDTPDNLDGPEPEPVWTTAPLVWHDGTVWVRGDVGEYRTAGDYWAKSHLDAPAQSVRDGARRFAREAVPVVAVPAAEWEAWKSATRDLDYTPDCELIDAVDSLAREVGE